MLPDQATINQRKGLWSCHLRIVFGYKETVVLPVFLRLPSSCIQARQPVLFEEKAYLNSLVTATLNTISFIRKNSLHTSLFKMPSSNSKPNMSFDTASISTDSIMSDKEKAQAQNEKKPSLAKRVVQGQRHHVLLGNLSHLQVDIIANMPYHLQLSRTSNLRSQESQRADVRPCPLGPGRAWKATMPSE
jgi:hypothetical protein